MCLTALSLDGGSYVTIQVYGVRMSRLHVFTYVFLLLFCCFWWYLLKYIIKVPKGMILECFYFLILLILVKYCV